MENINAITVDAEVIQSVLIGNVGDTVTMKEAIAIEKNGTIMKKKSGGNGVARKKKTAEAVLTSDGGVKGCTLQVSNYKKPLVFYLNLARKYINQKKYVELSALGMAIPTAVTIAEILKKDGWATEKDVTISSVPVKDDVTGRNFRKAKIDILLERTEKFKKDDLAFAAEGTSEISNNKNTEFSSETNQKVVEKKDQSGTSGSLTEENDPKTVSMELIEGSLTEENDLKTLSIGLVEGSLTEENDPKTVSMELIEGSLNEENDPKTVGIELFEGKVLSTDHKIE